MSKWTHTEEVELVGVNGYDKGGRMRLVASHEASAPFAMIRMGGAGPEECSGVGAMIGKKVRVTVTVEEVEE